MRSYGQYCPISRASEILAERWTLLIVRNLMLGCTSFNQIAGGVPGMSRSLLASRLRALEDAGVVASQQKRGRRGRDYRLTEAGRALSPVVAAMAQWGTHWVELQPEHTDPSFALWAWVHAHLCRSRLPRKRVVVQFEFPEQRPPHHRLWILFHPDDAELCFSHPKLASDLVVHAQSEAFTRWHIGKLSWPQALRSGAIRVDGPQALARALPTWNNRAASA